MNFINVLSNTLSAWEKGYYEYGHKKIALQTTLEEAKSSTVLLPDTITEICERPMKYYLSDICSIRCLKMDSFSCAIKRYYELKEKKTLTKDNQIAVLNFANPVHPGGGVRSGARAQEEDLCRRSSLLLSLENSSSKAYYEYNKHCDRFLSSDAMILSPKVEIIKDEDYMPLSESIVLNVITCAAPINCINRVKEDSKRKVVREQYYDLFYQRIQRMLKCSAYFGYRNLILGAWGCGAFGNDAKIVSNIFLKALEVKESTGIQLKDYFSSIDFAILGSSNLYHYQEFYRNFGNYNSKSGK